MKTSKRVLEKPEARYYGYHVDGYPVEGPKVEARARGQRWCIVDDDGRYREISKQTLRRVRERNQ